MSKHHLFPIRHHGPGSARALLAEFMRLQPDCILVEGPPDANHVLSYLGSPEMAAPVALLVYQPDQPGKAGTFPFARFSPEYQALRFGVRNAIHTKFFDLPYRHRLAADTRPAMPDAKWLNQLAAASGYGQFEHWWNSFVEQRRDFSDLFKGVVEMMTVVRAASDSEQGEIDSPEDRMAQQREAFMRQEIRAAINAGFERIAVVVGAWHSPALVQLGDGAADAALLADLPSVPIEAAWIPWTYSRLARQTGYGAGIQSPGWYDFVWRTSGESLDSETMIVRWLTAAAWLLREKGIDASSAHIIETARLAQALAALREKPVAGLQELNQAILTVMCFGNAEPLDLIQSKLIVSERMGQVPSDAPLVPLQVDLRKLQKRLDMAPYPEPRSYDLDLRAPLDLERSHLLHRLTLLGVPWGKKNRARGAEGTFREVWRLRWVPDFEVRVIEMSGWGNTIEEAAIQFVIDSAESTPTLKQLTQLLDDVILADLNAAVEAILTQIDNTAALSTDVPALIDALPPLVQIFRYGSVRQTDKTVIRRMIDSLVTRICINLPSTVASLDDNAAEEMFNSLNTMNGVVSLLRDSPQKEAWVATLQKLIWQPGLHNLIAGRACRLLLDGERISAETATKQLETALSMKSIRTMTHEQLIQVAFWIEGFLKGSGLAVLHDETLWGLIDDWVIRLEKEGFTNILPLLRRTFASFSEAARQQMHERIRHGSLRAVDESRPLQFDLERANLVLPTVKKYLGLSSPQSVLLP